MADNVALPSVYLFELAALRAELRTDYVSFRATASPGDSRSIVQPTAIKLLDAYDYFVTGIRASITGSGGDTASEDASADDVQELRFNLRSSDKDENLFSTDIELALLCNAWSGKPAAPITWFGSGYRIKAGSHLKCVFTQRGAITLARAMVVGVQCTLTPKGYHTQIPRF